MSKDRVNYRLENIEHAYFCFEKDCPVCGGFNYSLNEMYKEKINLTDNITEVINTKKNINIGEIWSLKIDSPYPIYVMPIEKHGFFYRCIRVSEFIEFKGEFDIVWNGWLFECWNSFPVLNIRFDKKIEKIDDNILKSIENKYRLFETNSDKIIEDNVLIVHFREMELNYQNYAFLEQDEVILIEAYEYESEKIISFKEKLNNILKDLKKTLQLPISNLKDTDFTPVPLAAADTDYYRFRIEEAIPFLQNENIVILINFLKKNKNNIIRLYIESFLDVEPEKIEIYFNEKKINYDLLYKDKENIYLDIPFNKGEYEIIFSFFNGLTKLPIKFKI